MESLGVALDMCLALRKCNCLASFWELVVAQWEWVDEVGHGSGIVTVGRGCVADCHIRHLCNTEFEVWVLM